MVQKDDVNKKTYNAIADIYVEEADLDHEDKSYIDSFLENVAGNKILDLGCGPGILSKYLSSNSKLATSETMNFASGAIPLAIEIICSAKSTPVTS